MQKSQFPEEAGAGDADAATGALEGEGVFDAGAAAALEGDGLFDAGAAAALEGDGLFETAC